MVRRWPHPILEKTPGSTYLTSVSDKDTRQADVSIGTCYRNEVEITNYTGRAVARTFTSKNAWFYVPDICVLHRCQVRRRFY